MANSGSFLGIFFALISAAVWGGGDFSGGLASRRSSPYAVLALSAFSGLVVLAVAALALNEPFPSPGGIVWAMLAGAGGALGIAALYRALSIGHAASVAPTAGVVGAALPVVFGIFTQGLPGVPRMVGFGLAMAGIWLVSTIPGGTRKSTRHELVLACLAGVGFGAFFIFIGQVESGRIFTPLIVSRSLTLITGLALTGLNRQPLPGLRSNPVALLAGILDAGGNLFFILAKQYTRLDIAVVLSSIYPAFTVLFSSMVLKERISPGQWLGVMICLAAIVLITI